VELAANGTFVWGKTFAGSDSGSYATSRGIAVDAAGAVYVTGTFTGTMDFDPGTTTDSHTSTGSGSSFLVKLTAAGNFGWARTYDDGNCEVDLAATAVASDGTVWATGSVQSGDGCTLDTRPSAFFQGDVIILKVGAAGDARGTWFVGSDQEESGAALAAGPNGSMYIGGTANGVLDYDPGAGVASRWLASGGGFVLKLDANGGFVWARVLNQLGINSMASTADGGVAAAGWSSTTPMVFATRLTSAGGSAWTFSFGSGSTSIMSLSASAGGFIIGGGTSGTVDFDPGPSIDPVYGDVSYLARFTF
jgi:hypothetical protein